jgi:hypothetical protein
LHSSFMANDVEGTLLVFIFFSIVFFTPGYVVGWVTDICSFRSASLFERIPTAVCLSVCFSPIAINLLARQFSVQSCSVIFLACFAVFLILVVFEWGRRPRIFPLPRYTLCGLALAGMIACVLILSLVDLQIGARIYPTAAVFDHGVRTAFIESAVRTGAPPANPFFYPGGLVPSRYYYFWSVLCALPVALFSAAPRVSLYGSAIWSVLAVASLIPLYFKHFLNERKSLYRKSLIGIALLAVTGFDLIPTLLLYWKQHFALSDMEWWDADQVTSWADAFVWVPHHVASLAACLGGLLVLWNSGDRSSWRRTSIHVGVAALAFASAAGLSAYVALGFSFFLAIWTLRYLVRRRWRAFGTFVAAGLLTLVISLPYLHDLRARGASVSPGAGEISSGQVSPAGGGGWLTLETRTLGIAPRGHAWTIPFQLLEVAVLYFFEFGFYAFVAWIVFRSQISRRRELPEAQRAAWYLTGTVVFLATFVRSSVIPNNDFGWRSMMLVQFVFLLWGASLIHELWFENPEERVFSHGLSRGWKTMLLGALALGFAGTLYQLIMLRSAMLFADRGIIHVLLRDAPAPPNVGRDTYEFRAGFKLLDKEIAPDSLVQYNPFAKDFNALLIYNRYQTVVAFPGCGIAFGGSKADCEALEQKLALIFPSESMPVAASADVDRLCDELKVQVLIVHRSDLLWGRPDSWVWTRMPLIANEAMKAFRCGTLRAAAR